MIKKRIIVLANSTKHHPKSCVAGRELLTVSDGRSRVGGWIRPVTNHDEGALDFVERRLADNKDPKPLDVVNVPLIAPEQNPLQPENWLIQAGEVWTKESAYDVHALVELVEQPANLWLDPARKIDRAGEVFLQKLEDLQSLYLICPENFCFQIRSKVWDGYAKKQLRGLFNYKGRHYNLSLTDPLIGRKYFPDYPRTADGIIQPRHTRDIVLCVSLTPLFEGLHYKVIASVLELAA